MRWEDEDYVKLYTRDTPEWLAVPLFARCFFYELTRKADRAGIIRLGKQGVKALAAAVRSTPEEVQPLLDALLEDGCVVLKDDRLVIPNYVRAQTARSSDRTRKQAERQRDRDLAMAESHGVTPGHTASRGVAQVSRGEERRGEEREESNSSEPQAAAEPLASPGPPSPVVARLPCVGKGPKEYAVTEAEVASWREAFPAVDVPEQLQRMRVWLEAHRSRRKTHGGVPKFVVGWLSRQQDAHPKENRNGRAGNADEALLRRNLEAAEREVGGARGSLEGGSPSYREIPAPAGEVPKARAAVPAAVGELLGPRWTAGGLQDGPPVEPGAQRGGEPPARAVREPRDDAR